MKDIDPAARVIILHGNDETAVREHIHGLISAMGDPTITEMNVSRLDGASAVLDDIVNAAGAAPFLAPYRLAVITELPRQDFNDNPRSRFLDRYAKDDSARARLLNYLSGLPESGKVVLAVDDQPGKKGGWELLRDNHWLMKWVQKSGGIAILVDCSQPDPRSMPDWIISKAKEMGGKFSKAAAAELASHVDNHTRLAEMEIGKLLDYVNYARQVEPEDVRLLVTYSGEVSIFDMIDGVAEGDAARAVRLLNVLLEKQEPEMLFGLILRQFRLLLAAREIREEGGRAKHILEQMSGEPFRVNHPFVAEKLYNQAGRYSLLRLEEIYRRLPDMSVAMKFNDARTELTAFITSLAAPGR